MTARTAEDVVDAVLARLRVTTGYRSDAIQRANVVRAIAARAPMSPAVVLEHLVNNDHDVTNALLEAISVGETYFFRQPAHFESLVNGVLPSLSKRSLVRAWCAGCSTGEEVYSVAACLRANLPERTRVEVIGTDIVERNVRAAAAGIYGAWSIRTASPLLYRLCSPLADGRLSVEPELRALTTFLCHNLLEPPPAVDKHEGPWGPFDIVFCRNVLIYFSLEATRTAVQNLVSSLAKDGVILFGTLDVSATPLGVERLGSPEANMFVRTSARPHPRTAPPPRLPLPHEEARRPSLISLRPLPSAVPTAAAVETHLQALEAIDRGRNDSAERILLTLHRSTPDYVPGIFELALLHVRCGRAEQAKDLMRELLRKTEGLPPDMTFPAPEELTISYYRVAAEAYLGGSERESKA